jgi:hypothetical protein
MHTKASLVGERNAEEQQDIKSRNIIEKDDNRNNLKRKCKESES